MWYLDELEYLEFNDEVHIFYLQSEITFSGKFTRKIKIVNLS